MYKIAIINAKKKNECMLYVAPDILSRDFHLFRNQGLLPFRESIKTVNFSDISDFMVKLYSLSIDFVPV